MSIKRGLVIEGGGFRASYAVGALYQLLKSPQIHFDVVCANSSSVCAAAYFITKQAKEIKKVFLETNILGSPKFLNFILLSSISDEITSPFSVA